MFCKMIAKDFKKLEGKWTYKVFMVGGAVFYEAPCSAENIKMSQGQEVQIP